MTPYIIILLAVICFAGQFAFTKLYENSVRQALLTSLIMLVFTSLIGSGLYLVIGGAHVEFSPVSVFFAALFAIVMIPYYIIGIKVLSFGSLAIYGMFMMLGGMLVPFFYGVWFLHESISVSQIIGTVLLTVFIILQAIWQNGTQQKGKQTSRQRVMFLLLCLAIFFLNGLTGVIAKAHQINENAVDEISFTVISCTLTAIFSLILLAFSFLRGRREKLRLAATVFKPKPIWIMCLLGAATYTGNLLHLIAASDVPASVQFPLVSGGVIIMSSLVSAFIFKEHISKKEWISIAGAFISTILFAF